MWLLETNYYKIYNYVISQAKQNALTLLFKKLHFLQRNLKGCITDKKNSAWGYKRNWWMWEKIGFSLNYCIKKNVQEWGCLVCDTSFVQKGKSSVQDKDWVSWENVQIIERSMQKDGSDDVMVSDIASFYFIFAETDKHKLGGKKDQPPNHQASLTSTMSILCN